jgi:hypothetical protein
MAIRGSQNVLHSSRYCLFATSGKHDFQLFATMRGLDLQSKKTKSTVMTYVEITQGSHYRNMMDGIT